MLLFSFLENNSELTVIPISVAWGDLFILILVLSWRLHRVEICGLKVHILSLVMK